MGYAAPLGNRPPPAAGGPQGAAKTTTARLRRRLIDPSRVATVVMRREVSEFVQALDHHYMLILDNLSGLSSWQEEMLCQAATGGGFTKRALYSDQDDVLFRFCRPVVLTGINLPSAAPDLLDRAVLIGLERIDESARRDERALWREFDALRPVLLAGLLGALAEALRIEPGLKLPRLSRMADFCRWGAAAAEALGFGVDRFLTALRRNAVKQGEEVLEDDPLAEAVQELVRRKGGFVGSATEMLAALLEVAGGQRRGGLPRHAADLGKRLTGLRAPLSELGITVMSQRQAGGNRLRSWVVRGPAAAGRVGRSSGFFRRPMLGGLPADRHPPAANLIASPQIRKEKNKFSLASHRQGTPAPKCRRPSLQQPRPPSSR